MKILISYTMTVIAAAVLLFMVMGEAYGGSANTNLNVATTIVVPNQPPTVTYTSIYSGGVCPVTVTYTADAIDPDGIIVYYEWDFDNDGTYEQGGPGFRIISYNYTAETYNGATVRVTDDDGATATFSAFMFICYYY